MFKPLAELLKNDILRWHNPGRLQTQNAVDTCTYRSSLSLSGYLNAVLIFLHMKEQSFNMDFVRAFAQNGGFRQKLREYVGKKTEHATWSETLEYV